MNVLLVGHRGTGKSTLGPLIAARLGWSFADLDSLIEEATGTTCAELVASDEDAFRKLEREMFLTVLAQPPRVIAAGAGLRDLGHDALIVWIQREGWDEAAEAERARLRPELTWEEERAWMIETREPRWGRAAHLHYHLPRGRAPEHAAEEIATMVRWCAPQQQPSLRSEAWIVPQFADDLARASADVNRFGLAGVEVRSDRFPTMPELDVAVLASLRTDDGAWLRSCAHVAAVDIDCQFLPAAESADFFAGTPRPLVLSTHPARLNPDDVSALARAARSVQERHPAWLEHLSLKYAPKIDDPDEIGMGRAMMEPLRRAGLAVTFLPQGAQWAWSRPLLAAENATHYVAARLRTGRWNHGDESGLTPMDLQDWLPHFAGAPPQFYDALVGDPVEHSRGDLWHRAAALQSGEQTGYVKARVHEPELDGTLAAFAQLGVRGVSVTSPLKRRISFVCPDDATFGPLLTLEDAARAASRGMPVRNGNTLVRTPTGWLATDTDELGMAACLEHIEQAGFGPGTVAILGRGGVAPAVLRAIATSDWFVVLHASAREGWPDERPGFVTLVINAGGPTIDASINAPRCDVWLDLHYFGVDAVEATQQHLNGDVFFEAQAEAQRDFWAARFEA